MTGTVLVTGGTGNLGVRVVDALADDPDVQNVVTLARRPPDVQRAEVRHASADLMVDDLQAPLAGVEAVVHLAWLFQPMHDQDATWRNNVVGTRRLLDAVAASDVRTFVCVTSIGAYSPADGRVVDESWPTDGGPAAYGREKAAVERLLDDFEARHPDRRVVRLRPAFVFQRTSAAEQHRLFVGPLLPLSVLVPRLVPVLPWPRGITLQAVHTTDVADAFRLAVQRDVSGAFNLAAEPVLGGQDIADLMGARLVPVPARLVREAIRIGFATRALPTAPELFDMAQRLPVMDVSRARSELGWEPKHDARDAIAEVLQGLEDSAGEQTPPLRG